MNIPKGYRPIAVRDDRMGTCVVSYNLKTQRYWFAIDGKDGGPYTLNELKVLVANLKDVIDLKGRYIYIEEYSNDGTRVELA